MAFDARDWANSTSGLVRYIVESNQRTLETYKTQPRLVREHANIERATAQGGYGRRQLFELIQNGADALVGTRDGRIHILLTESALYCANEGEPVHQSGVDALLSSHISEKRGTEIGRFGLGFKSVLGVTEMPEFYSWTACFGFDAEWSRQEILDLLPDLAALNQDDRTPVLRMARALDAASEADSDPILKDLMSWATTVIKLPLNLDRAHWLPEDLSQFPSEFLLFSPHVGEVRLEDRTTSTAEVTSGYLDRVIKVEEAGTKRRLIEGGEESDWHVFEVPEFEPSAKALADAGELAHRETVPVIWAVPVSGRKAQAKGRFWAFFPTEYETSLAGILNVPWKTNEDRLNLLPGDFNTELIDQIAEMVVQALDSLINPDDPGYFLELLPGRSKETFNWADQRITSKVYKLAALVPSLPDQDGVLQKPADLKLHPEEADGAALEAWVSHASRPRNWCHSKVRTRDRRARAVRLMEEVNRYPSSVQTWLKEVAADHTVEGSSAAIRAATALIANDPRIKTRIKMTQFVLTVDQDLAFPDPSRLFFPKEYGSSTDELQFVHEALVDDPEAKTALEELGIRDPEELAELSGVLEWGLNDSTDWASFWGLVARVDPREAIPLFRAAIENRKPIRVKTSADSFEPWEEVLLPGRVIPEENVLEEDSWVLVDLEFHSDHVQILESIGVVDAPDSEGGYLLEWWFEEYSDEAREEYYFLLDPESSRPQWEYLEFDQSEFVGPLASIKFLTPESCARLTHIALEQVSELRWTLRHKTQDKYPTTSVLPPDLWILVRDGYLATSLGPVPIGDAVAPSLGAWSDLLPVADCSIHVAELTELPTDIADLGTLRWDKALERAKDPETPYGVIGAFYAAACHSQEVPRWIRCQVGSDDESSAPPKEVTVVHDVREFEALTQIEDPPPVLLVPDHSAAQDLVSAWELKRADTQVRTELINQPSALGVTIEERYPDLIPALDGDDLAMTLQPCLNIQRVTLTASGRSSEETVFAVDQEAGVVLFRQDLDDRQLLELLSVEFELGLENTEIEGIIDNRQSSEMRSRMEEIQSKSDSAEKLALLVDEDALIAHLPENLVLSLNGDEPAHEIAKLALASHGVLTLKELRVELGEAGWPVPNRWAAGRDAREFVASLGFDQSFAGFPERRWDATLTVDGPADLPPMHEFQKSISSAMTNLIGKSGGNRSLLSLPTGAGKTRVAVESIIWGLEQAVLSGPVLWVAQTQELCEQAVQTWAYLWRAIGPTERLHISRLWDSNEATAVKSGHQVVVATIAKLQHCFGEEEYEWLAAASCLVIDEAHLAVGPSYTRLLNWQGMGRNKNRVPLFGLTATPFRGTSESETEALVKRFGGTRLDANVFGEDDPYVHLQDLGVLSKVDHELLPGIDIQLSEEELEELARTRRLPPAVGERIGADPTRNQTLLNSIGGLPEDWPVLVFATSVDHAQTMSALLEMRGISAAAISATTDVGARRHYIEAFRQGHVRVLTNYGVLSQGFDAPATRAVYVARPTYSPNLYQQMIGRGLRGPLNGGKDVCLIVNVEDNFAQFGEKLSFYDYEYLWNRD